MNKYQNIIENGMVRPLSELQAAVFDLDGTVYYGNDLIPGAKETISFFREKGLRVLFATNNSGRTRSSLTRKLNRLGIECVEDDVYNSGYVAVRFVEERGLKNIYVVGSAPFKEEMAQVSNMTDEEHADTLVVGIDLEFDYEEMTRAIRAALRADTIIYCNQDMTYLGEGGKVFPGSGAMTSVITNCSGKEPDYVVGKPFTPMFELISRNTGIPCDKMVMIGDSYGSDVGFARNAGAEAIFIGEGHDDVVSVRDVGDIPHLFE